MLFNIRIRQLSQQLPDGMLPNSASQNPTKSVIFTTQYGQNQAVETEFVVKRFVFELI